MDGLKGNGLLIADSGSTKCDWLLVDGERQLRFRTSGINAALHAGCDIEASLSQLPEGWRPRVVRFYGAGCGEHFPEPSARLAESLARRFGCDDVAVESDLTGAARALFGARGGVACILGTGSNSGLWNGRRIVCNVPPLGYVLGDEGGGAALGRHLVNGIYKGVIPLRAPFERRYGLDLGEVIRRVYREPAANRFLASFAPFVLGHLERPEVARMVRACFAEFVERNLLQYPAAAEVSFVGSIAFHFAAPLAETLNRYGLRIGTIVASPVGGLLAYHLEDHGT